jgi:hypothetical protein
MNIGVDITAYGVVIAVIAITITWKIAKKMATLMMCAAIIMVVVGWMIATGSIAI